MGVLKSGRALPIALVCGEADREAPFGECAAWLHARIPRSTLHSAGQHVGHYTYLCEGTEAGRRARPFEFVDHPEVSRRGVHDHAAAVARQLFGT